MEEVLLVAVAVIGMVVAEARSGWCCGDDGGKVEVLTDGIGGDRDEVGQG